MCKVTRSFEQQQGTYRDLPHDVLWEIFNKMSRVELARLCPEFEEVIQDTRLWQNVCIRYSYPEKDDGPCLPFEDLFTGPCPIKKISFHNCQIKPPVTTEMQQVEVTQLDFSGHHFPLDTRAIEALAVRYPCKELILDLNDFHNLDLVMEHVSKQEKFEKLSLRRAKRRPMQVSRHQWLKNFLKTYCSNLKNLHLCQAMLSREELLCVFANAPKSLEMMGLYCYGLDDPDTDLAILAKSCPNLKKLKLDGRYATFSSLLEFRFLESLHIDSFWVDDLTSLHRHLIKHQNLKSIYILGNHSAISLPAINWVKQDISAQAENLRVIMEPHNVKVELDCATDDDCRWSSNVWMNFLSNI